MCDDKVHLRCEAAGEWVSIPRPGRRSAGLFGAFAVMKFVRGGDDLAGRGARASDVIHLAQARGIYSCFSLKKKNRIKIQP